MQDDVSNKSEAFEFTWTIENFDMCLHREDKTVKSPWFEYEVEGQLRANYRLKLCPRTMLNDCPEDIVCSLEHINVCAKTQHFEVSILDTAGSVYMSRSNSHLVTPSEPLKNTGKNTGSLCSMLLCKRDFIIKHRKDILLKDSLTLKCQVWAVYDTKNSIEDIMVLSQDMKVMYNTKVYYDLVLYTDDEAIPVHKFILYYRARELATRLGMTDVTSKIKIEDMSIPVLKALIEYLYTGELGKISNEELPELCKLVETYNINLFLDTVQSATNFGSTRLKVVRKTIDLRIKNYSYQGPIVIHNYVDLELAQFIVVFSKIKDTRGKYSLKISIQRIHRSPTEKMVYLTCKTTTATEVDEKAGYLQEREHWFHNKETLFRHDFDQKPNSEETSLIKPVHVSEDMRHEFPPIFLTEDELRRLVYLPIDVLQLRLDLAVTTGETTSDSLRFTLTPTGTHSQISNLMSLKQDLFECMVFRDFADVRICLQDSELDVHKAMLASRLPGLAQILRKHRKSFHNTEGKVDVSGALQVDMKRVEVDISFVSSDTMYDLLEYIYAAEFTIRSADSVLKLYDVAKRFEISALAEMCAIILKSNVNSK